MNKISLVLATLGRPALIAEFLECIKNQTYKNVEVIIIDQGYDKELEINCRKYNEFFEVKYINSPKGLSRARNKGLKQVTGDIVAFPDDDCIYEENLLEEINKVFINDNQKKFISIKMKNSFLPGRKINEGIKSQSVTKDNIFKLVSSISMFIKIDVVKELNGFDEEIGLGSGTMFNGGEDYDYPLKAMNRGINIYYLNNIEVLHPWDNMDITKSKGELEKAYKGGASEMYILNKYKYGIWYKFRRCIRRCAIIIYYLVKGNFYNMRVSVNILKGMIRYFTYRKLEW